jgi:phosphatidylglycerophosphate synthase
MEKRSAAIVLPPTERSFWRVGGLSVLERAVLVAERAGFGRAAVWAENGRQARLEQSTSRRNGCGSRAALPLVSAPQWESATWLVLPSDAVWTQDLLISASLLPRPEGVQEIDAGGGVVFWRAPGSHLARLLEACSPAEAAVRLHEAATERVKVAGRAVRLDHPGAIGEAERLLSDEIRHRAAQSDGVLARWFDRRLSLWLSRKIVRYTRLRPNHITVLGTLVGLLAAACFARGDYTSQVLGSVLFWFATVIDGCDGEVARLKLCESKFGEVLDVTTDNLVHAALFLGLGVGYARAYPEAPYGWLTGLLLVGFLCAAGASYFALVLHPELFSEIPQSASGAERLRARLLGALKALMTRDFSYLLLLLALIDRAHWFLWGAAFGSFGFCLAVLSLYAWQPRAR